MKVGRDYAWWVAYSYTCECFDPETKQWEEWYDYDADRFTCRKKDIEAEIMKRIEEDLYGEKFRNVQVTIDDCYKTTPEEI